MDQVPDTWIQARFGYPSSLLGRGVTRYIYGLFHVERREHEHMLAHWLRVYTYCTPEHRCNKTAPESKSKEHRVAMAMSGLIPSLHQLSIGPKVVRPGRERPAPFLSKRIQPTRVTTCAICFESTDGIVISGKCTHSFHVDCMRQYATSKMPYRDFVTLDNIWNANLPCPTCRQPFNKVEDLLP